MVNDYQRFKDRYDLFDTVKLDCWKRKRSIKNELFITVTACI